jgi:hypothetical protein
MPCPAPMLGGTPPIRIGTNPTRAVIPNPAALAEADQKGLSGRRLIEPGRKDAWQHRAIRLRFGSAHLAPRVVLRGGRL